MQSGIYGPIPTDLNVFETMRLEGDGRIALLPLHLARLRTGCAALGFPLDEDRVAAAPAGLPLGQVLRVRLALGADGQIGLTHAPLPSNPPFWRVFISAQRLESADPWLRIKTTHRPAYEAARAMLTDGADEAILRNENDEVCEGTITNLFLSRSGTMLTPPLTCGLLPGVLRQSLLQSGQAEERILFVDDLQSGDLFMGNALRGLIPAKLVA